MFSVFLRRLTRALAAATMLVAGIAVPAQTSVLLHSIMSNLPNSPYLFSTTGQTVQTTGVVVGVMVGGGFYLSSPDNEWDGDVSTAEGMPVFGSPVTACNSVAVGDVITVSGMVVNSSVVTAANTPGTGLDPTACSKSGTATVTNDIDLSRAGVLVSFGDALKFTGMSATDSTFAAISPTGGTSANNSVSSNGQFWGVLASSLSTNSHLFRSAGIAGDEYVPAGAPSGVPRWSGNPQRVLIDTTTFGGPPLDIGVGQTVSCVAGSGITAGPTTGIGLMDYTLGYARFLIFKTTSCNPVGMVQPSVAAPADTSHFKVGTLDVNAFLGPGSILSASSVLPTALPKAVQTVTGVFGSPDIFALQQVSDQNSLQYLADAANQANSGSTNYVATVRGTNQINSGFLVNSNTVLNTTYLEEGGSATYIMASGTTAMLWDYPPLVMTGEFARPGRNYPVVVIDVEFASRDNSGDPVLGPDVRTRRAAQAAAVSALVQQYQTRGANVIVAGDFNGYEFNDGYVDVIGIVDGAPAAQGTVTLYQASSTTEPLTDFTTQVPASARYNTIESGNAAALEHILASATVVDSASAAAPLATYGVATQPHFTADNAAIRANDPSTPAGLTPHDGFVVTFALPPVPTAATLLPSAADFGAQIVGTRSTARTFMWTNTSPVPVAISSVDPTGDYSVGTNTCVGLIAANSSCSVSIVFTPIALGTRTGTLTVASASTLNGTLTAALTGVGVSSVQASAYALNFGNVDVTASSAPQAVTITNNTNAALPLGGLIVSGDYSQTNTCGGALAPHGTCVVTVVFRPAALGARPGSATIVPGGLSTPLITVALSGNGVDFAVAVSPTSGNVIAGFSVSPGVTLTPMGGFNAAITMSCTTSAPGTGCAYGQSKLTPAGATPDALTITTTSKYTVIGYGALLSPPAGRNLFLALLGLCGVGALLTGKQRVRSAGRLLAIFAAVSLLAGGLSGCSGKLPDLNSPYTAPGNYTIQVTATDGVLTHTAAYALTVTAK